MYGSIRIGTIRGIPLQISATWLIVFVLFLWTFAASYYPDRYEGWTSQAYFAAALITVVLFFASIILHELGHATIAARTGIRTRSITLLPIGGVAEIEREAEKPSEDFAIAIAGPITSFLLGGLFLGLHFLLKSINVPLGGITAYLGLANLFLGVFNLLPGFPMDGGRILRAIVWGATKSYTRGTQVAGWVGSLVAYIFIFFGVSLLFRGQSANGVILAFTGWFILSNAQASVQQVTLQRDLGGVTVSQVMMRTFPTVQSGETIAQVITETFLAQNTRFAAVEQNGRFVGLVTLADLMRVPREQWGTVRAEPTMIPRGRLVTARPDESVLTVLHRMQENDHNQLPVIADDHMVGLLTRNDILRFVQLRASLHLPPTGDDRKPPATPEQVPQ
jgi:Zn-dependent protease/CBS domain-containing protein